MPDLKEAYSPRIKQSSKKGQTYFTSPGQPGSITKRHSLFKSDGGPLLTNVANFGVRLSQGSSRSDLKMLVSSNSTQVKGAYSLEEDPLVR